MSSRFESSMDAEELAKYLEDNELMDEDTPVEYNQPDLFKKSVNRKIIVDVAPTSTKKEALTPQERLHLANESTKHYLAVKRQQVRDVKRELVLARKSYVLAEPVSKVEIQLIVEELTSKYTEAAEKAKSKLTSMIEQKLKLYIPQGIKVAFKTNPAAFAKYEGFYYESSPFFDRATLHIKPDIPNVFTGPTEMDVIKAKCQKFRYTYDRLVESYYLAIKTRTVKETRLALKMTKVKCVLDLLDLGIEFYNAYLKITGQ